MRRNPPCLSAADDAGEENDDKPRHQQNLNIDHISHILFKILFSDSLRKSYCSTVTRDYCVKFPSAFFLSSLVFQDLCKFVELRT